MQGKSNEPFLNQIEERTGEDFEYSLAPEGVQLCGLVKVKNKMRFNKFSNANEAAIQFTFRLKDDPSAYVNHTVAAKLNVKSNLFKTLQKMSGYQYKLDEGKGVNNSQAAYSLIQRLDNSWFDVTVLHKPSSKPGVNVVYSIIPDNQIAPARACPNITPKEWFEQHGSKRSLQPAIPSAPQPAAKGESVPDWLNAPEKEGDSVAYNPDDDDNIPF